jgi:hypothetical protein
MEEDMKKLNENIEKLSGKVSKLSSFRVTFLRGILFGLGSAIGAGLIAAILVGAFNWFIHSFDGVPVLKNIGSIEFKK